MSLKQRILQLLSEEKSITEVQKILGCSKAYVRSCKSLLPNYNRIKKIKVNNRIHIIKLKCANCGIVLKIRTSRPEAYTDEVKKKWLCLKCMDKRL